MCEIYSTWKELVKQYDKLKTMRRRKDEVVKTRRQIDDIRAMEKAAQVRIMIGEWLQNNEKYNNIYPLNSSKSSEEDLLSISTKNKGSQTQESPLKNTNSAKKYAPKKNTECYHSCQNYQPEEKVNRKRDHQSTNIRPHTSYIFTPPDLNVTYINPIPWNKE
ncbi:uncharacterized protein isoform X2 [Rhodnius prolixus]|uniref:uncharacterized protein isoform X2 n=1 Tax=Rhodnius prolixus TaxID=13249 RepID=UPI003D18F540